MKGVLINVVAVLIGGGLGLVLRGGIPQRIRDTLMQALALCVCAIGIQGALKTENVLCVIVCAVLGGLAGSLLNIEARLERLGGFFERRFARGQQGFALAFVTSSLVYCIGAMAIVGSLEAGLTGKTDTLAAKSMLDGVSSVLFASTMGAGVLLSALPILVYQGAIALLSGFLSPALTQSAIREMSAVGGVLILGIGINMLGISKLRVGNMLPAILLPPLLLPLLALLPL